MGNGHWCWFWCRCLRRLWLNGGIVARGRRCGRQAGVFVDELDVIGEQVVVGTPTKLVVVHVCGALAKDS